MLSLLIIAIVALGIILCLGFSLVIKWQNTYHSLMLEQDERKVLETTLNQMCDTPALNGEWNVVDMKTMDTSYIVGISYYVRGVGTRFLPIKEFVFKDEDDDKEYVKQCAIELIELLNYNYKV